MEEQILGKLEWRVSPTTSSYWASYYMQKWDFFVSEEKVEARLAFCYNTEDV